MEDKAYQLGREAFAEGHSYFSANPYQLPYSPEFIKAWERGWTDARDEQRKARKEDSQR